MVPTMPADQQAVTYVADNGQNYSTCFNNCNIVLVDNNTGGPSEEDRAFENGIRYVVVIVFTVIFLLGIFGNSLVIHVILSRRRMRTVSNLFLMNLAFADLTFILICVPTTALNYAMESWPLGLIMCKINQYLLFVTVYVTIYTLVMISAIRFLAVVFPLESSNLRTRKNALICIVVIWMVMLAVNIPILISCKMYTYDYHGETRSVCLIDPSPTFEKAKLYYASFFAFAYLIPLVIICVLAGGIVRRLLMKNETDHEHIKMRRKKDATKTTIFVVLLFAISWLPINIILMINYFGKEEWFTKVFVVFQVLANCLSYGNSCINPILYNFLSKDFRRHFHRTLFCRNRSHNADYYATRTFSAGSMPARDGTTVSFRISFKHSVNQDQHTRLTSSVCNVRMEEPM